MHFTTGANTPGYGVEMSWAWHVSCSDIKNNILLFISWTADQLQFFYSIFCKFIPNMDEWLESNWIKIVGNPVKMLGRAHRSRNITGGINPKENMASQNLKNRETSKQGETESRLKRLIKCTTKVLENEKEAVKKLKKGVKQRKRAIQRSLWRPLQSMMRVKKVLS